MVPVGSEVQVVVSSGPGDVVIPEDLVGLEQGDVRDRLTELGLVGGNALPTTSPDVAAGLVVQTDPATGQTVAKGTTVTIYTSNGQTVVPSVKGKMREEAEGLIRSAGLTLADPNFELSEKPAGTVLKQSLKAKSEQAQGTQITLTLAREPKALTMPDLSALTKDSADVELANRSLTGSYKYEYSETVAADRVIRTNPAANQTVNEGSTVTVVLSKGPEPVVTPTPTIVEPVIQQAAWLRPQRMP
jgi:serine/threonine-protein kinase